jgi:hypothetical protein
MKSIFIILIISIALLGTFSAIFFYQATNNIPQETIKEKVCYPAIYSIHNGQVVEIEPSKCEFVKR